MGRKCRVITAAVIHMKHHRHIQDLRLQLRVLSVLTKHHQDILSHGQLRSRCIDKEILTSAEIICMITVHHQHRKLADQIQALTQYIRNRRIVCLCVIAVKTQD